MPGDRGFRRLFVGDAVSGFGDWFTYIGVSAVAISQPQRELALLAVVAQTLPRALLAPVAGMLADRVDRRKLLCVATVGRGLCAAAMAGCAVAGWLWAVHAWHLARMGLGAFTDAASRATLPSLVAPAKLATANATLGASWNAMFIAGVAAGGVVTALAGPAAAFAFDALTFALAALVFSRLPTSRQAATAGAVAVDRNRSLANDRTRPSLARYATLAKVPVAIATGAGWVALTEAAGVRASASTIALALGGVHVVRAIGAGVAPLVWPRAWRGSVRGVQIATAIAIVAVASFGLCAESFAGLACAAAWGIGVGASWVTATTLLQSSIADRSLGRASTLDIAAQTTAQGVGSVLALSIVVAGGSLATVCLAGAVAASLAWLAIERVISTIGDSRAIVARRAAQVVDRVDVAPSAMRSRLAAVGRW